MQQLSGLQPARVLQYPRLALPRPRACPLLLLSDRDVITWTETFREETPRRQARCYQVLAAASRRAQSPPLFSLCMLVRVLDACANHWLGTSCDGLRFFPAPGAPKNHMKA